MTEIKPAVNWQGLLVSMLGLFFAFFKGITVQCYSSKDILFGFPLHFDFAKFRKLCDIFLMTLVMLI